MAEVADAADEGQSSAVLGRVPVCGFDIVRTMSSTLFSRYDSAFYRCSFEGYEIMRVIACCLYTGAGDRHVAGAFEL